MAKKDDFYFDCFVKCVELSCSAAELLEETLRGFDEETLKMKLDAIHEVEHAADQEKHTLMNELTRAFMTPIERNDIVALSQNIDDVTDSIEDTLIHIYVNRVSTIRPEGIQFASLIVRCCKELKSLMEEFRNFKKSKHLKEHIIMINQMEEEGDRLYLQAMRDLHTKDTPPLEVIAWREIYDYLEDCCDACEDVADIVESIVIENT